jgi:cupin fold WbuC family metalloprotein
MANVYFNKENFICVGEDWLDKLTEAAIQSERQTSRLLMHNDPKEVVQEMLIAFTNRSAVTPNRCPSKSESLHVLRGEIALLVFDDSGNVVERLTMAPTGSGKPFMYRLCDTPWHAMASLTPTSVVHEVLQGPFVPSTETAPAWVGDQNAAWRSAISELPGNR